MPLTPKEREESVQAVELLAQTIALLRERTRILSQFDQTLLRAMRDLAQAAEHLRSDEKTWAEVNK